MRITVSSATHKSLSFHISNKWILNPIIALALPGFSKKSGIMLSRKQVSAAIQAVHTYRRNHSGWNPIEVLDASGNHIEITV